MITPFISVARRTARHGGTLLSLALLLSSGLAASAQGDNGSFTLKEQSPANPDNEPKPVFPVPSARQLKWNQTEFYAFFHYGMNTYTGQEWGEGNESENLFAPTQKPNPRQWLETIKAGGMRGGIAVVKHHDGFCLWPTASTTHNVTSSSNAFAKETNIPKDFAEAARDLGLKYGFYVSPWDRNSALYGKPEYVSEVFLRQCAELAEYGTDQFEMWFDGANGGSGYYGGANETRQIDASIYYDVPNLRDSVHKQCPDIILWGVGGEARWIGNEAGWAGETCWSYGSGETGDENAWQWCAGESDAKATSGGWFYHDGETVKSAEELFKIYLETVGRNATLILNFPPNKAGVLPDHDVEAITELGQMLKTRLGNDLARNAKVTVSEERTAGANRNYAAANLTDADSTTYWATNDGTTSATITLTWDEPQTVHYVTMMEYITLGQRVKGFTIETSEDGATGWTRRGPATQTTIGYKRIIPLGGSTTNSYSTSYTIKGLRLTITDSKACPTLHTLSVF